MVRQGAHKKGIRVCSEENVVLNIAALGGQKSSFLLETEKHLTLANVGKVESMDGICVLWLESEEEGALLCCSSEMTA